jgi:hypothetical protein
MRTADRKMTNIETIPIVYLWVNASDPDYRARYGLQSVSCRDRDNNDLLYSLRSLEKNLPWWRGTLYLVTDNQIPEWIQEYHLRIKIISHKDIIPKNFLPTRVSYTIEWFLYNIPDIHDLFITMNDDFMFLKPCEPSDFLHSDMKPILSFNDNKLNTTPEVLDKFKSKNDTWLYSVHNSVAVLEKKLGKSFENKYYIQHAPRIFSKKIITDLFFLMSDEIVKSVSIKERTMDTLDTIYVITYYMAHRMKLDIMPNMHKEKFVEIEDTINFEELYTSITQDSSSYFLCCNDKFIYEGTSRKLQDLYKRIYPEPSVFERQSIRPSCSITEKFRFVSFYSEGLPHDKGYELSHYDGLARTLLKNQCPIEMYTPRKLRELGYEYSVKEFDDTGCVTGNKKAEKLGFYAWKPLIIWLELLKMNDGGILLFHDLNIDKYPAYKDNFNKIFTFAEVCLDECGFDFFVSRENNIKRMFHHCKSMVIRELGGDHPFFYNFPQAIVNIMFIRKSKASMALVKEWMEACKNERWISGVRDENPHPGFIFHCPEQAILNAIIAKWVAEKTYNIPSHYPNIIFSGRSISSRVHVSPNNCTHMNYLLDYKGIQPMKSIPSIHCIRFTSFIEDDDKLKAYQIQKELFGRFPVELYTSTTLKTLGYSVCNEAYTWKPLILWLELQKLHEGDTLLFLDLYGDKYAVNKKNLHHKLVQCATECLQECNFDLFVSREPNQSNVPSLCLKTNCKSAVIREVGVPNIFMYHFPQINSNIIFMKKSQISMRIIEEWMNACKVDKWVNDSYNPFSHPDFRKHVPDTGIVNTILARYVLQRTADIPLYYPNIQFVSQNIQHKKTVDLKDYTYLESLLSMKPIKPTQSITQ